MVAYSFQSRFRPKIEARLKRHTLRNDRKRHARVGEALQLYTGMRTRQCKKIGDATCTAVLRIRLDFEYRRVEFLESGHAITTPDDTDAFAVGDGFDDWKDMRAFWAEQHPEITKAWEGVMIQWGETLVLPPAG